MAVEYAYLVEQYSRPNRAGGSSSSWHDLNDVVSAISRALDGAYAQGWPLVTVSARPPRPGLVGRTILSFTREHGGWEATVAGYLIEEAEDGSWMVDIGSLPADPQLRAVFIAFCCGADIEIAQECEPMQQWLVAWNPIKLATACEMRRATA